jgi:hypothetical protein
VAVFSDRDDGALWIRGEDKTWIRWGEAPGAEAPGRPTAAEKWEMLRDWARHHVPSGVVHPDFLAFTKDGVERRKGTARTP